MEKTNDDKIKEIYTDQAGYQSLANTYKDVKKKYPDIKYDDVKRWYHNNVGYNFVKRGYNSFVPNEPLEQVQVDLFFINDKPDDVYKFAIAGIDCFTKYGVVIGLSDKKPEQFVEALKRIFKEIGGKPKTLFSDQEGSLSSKLVDNFLKKENIKYIITRNHAPFVESFIRTFKRMIFKRLKVQPEKRWYDFIFESILTYNHKMVNRTTGFKPVDAIKTKNLMTVKMNMEENASNNKQYEEINEGDKVFIFKKRKNFQKQNISKWSQNSFTVDKIEKDPVNGKSYHVRGYDKPFLRSEIQKHS